MTKMKVLQQFAAQIARMQTEQETINGYVSEDAMATVNDLIVSARQLTGIDPEYPQVYCPLCDSGLDNCDCEPAGECLTCGTQCDDEGICPVCARYEAAQEAGDHTAAQAALDAPIDSCRKCGAALTLRDVEGGNACTDQGEGPEAGKVFVYCGDHCRDTH